MKTSQKVVVIAGFFFLMMLGMLAQAQEDDVTPIDFGDQVEGTLTEENFQAVYEFEADAGTAVTITLESIDFDAYLQLIGTDAETVVAEDDDSAGRLNSQIIYTIPEGGAYGIIATSLRAHSSDGEFVATGDFTLTLDGEAGELVEQPEATPEAEMTDAPEMTAEPDDEDSTLVVGNELSYGDTVEGELTDSMPEVDYTFSAAEGDRVVITLTSNDFDAYLILFDAAGEVIIFDDDGAGNFNSQISAFEIPADGEYTIRASSFGQSNAFAPEVGAFELTLTLEDSAIVEGDDPEGDDPDEDTTEIDLEYGEEIRDQLSQSVPEAEYDFIGAEGDLIIITLTSDDLDTYLFLLDADGEEIRVDDDSAGNLNSQIGPFEIPADGVYTVVVSSFGQVADGTPEFGAFSLDIAQVEAQQITIDEPITGEINADTGSTLAAYTVDVDAGETVAFILETNNFSVFMSVQSAEGDFDQQTFGGSDILGPLTPAGDSRYTLVVNTFDSFIVADYTLTVQTVIPQALTRNEPIEADFSESPLLYYTFDAEVNDTISVMVMSEGRVDTIASVNTSDGVELAFDDDSGSGFDPEINDLVLDQTGAYAVVIRPYIEGDQGEITLLVEDTGTGSIDDDSQIVRISDKQFQGVVTFEGVAGERVLLSAEVITKGNSNPVIRVTQGETVIASNPVGQVERLLLEFTVPEDGNVQVFLEDFEIGSAVVEFSLERLEGEDDE